jgi:hypothetical protein
MDATSWPAVWSATAATLSALVAWMVLRIHRQNAIQSVRPELIIENWHLTGDAPEPDWFNLGMIKNVGNGLAVTVIVNASVNNDSKCPVISTATSHLPYIYPDKELPLESGHIWWKNASDETFVTFRADAYCWDVHGNRYIFEFTFLARRYPQIGMSGGRAVELDRLTLISRRVRFRSHRYLAILRTLRRVKRVRQWWETQPEGVRDMGIAHPAAWGLLIGKW